MYRSVDAKLLVPRRTLNIAQVNDYCNRKHDYIYQGGNTYDFYGIVGHGTFGMVYRAERISYSGHGHAQAEGLKVAIKLIGIESSHKIVNATKLHQVKPESKFLFKLKHRHIVAYYDSYYYSVPSHSEGLAIVFSYCPKGDLQSYLSHSIKHIADITIRFRWYSQLASACDYMHRQNVIHYDLEPANILVDSHGNLKICDVGMAKIAWDIWTAHDSQDTVSLYQYLTSAASTKYYMAPEVWSQQYTSECDVFSLGLVYIKICESQSFSNAPTASQERPFGQVLSRNVRNPCAVIACAFEQAENIELLLCNKMLQYDPNSRPSMSDVEQETEDMMSNASKLLSCTRHLATSIESLAGGFQQCAFMHAVVAFHQAADAVYIQSETIKTNCDVPEISQVIKEVDGAFCDVCDMLSSVEMDLVPGLGLDQVIKSCKQNKPDFDAMEMLFDAKRLDTSLQELENSCKKVKYTCTSAVEFCDKMAQLRFGERMRILSCLFLLLSLATFVPAAYAWSILAPSFQGLTSLNILDSTATLILSMTALVLGTLLTYIYYLYNMDHESAKKTLQNSTENLGSLRKSSLELHQAVLDTYDKIDHVKQSIEALRQYCDDYGHRISDAIALSLSQLKQI